MNPWGVQPTHQQATHSTIDGTHQAHSSDLTQGASRRRRIVRSLRNRPARTSTPHATRAFTASAPRRYRRSHHCSGRTYPTLPDQSNLQASRCVNARRTPPPHCQMASRSLLPPLILARHSAPWASRARSPTRALQAYRPPVPNPSLSQAGAGFRFSFGAPLLLLRLRKDVLLDDEPRSARGGGDDEPARCRSAGGSATTLPTAAVHSR